MKDFNEMTRAEQDAYLMECYKGLTPENKDKFILKCAELLAEQELGSRKA